MRRNGSGSRGKFGTSAYAASKAGLIGLAKSVSRETGRYGILVNVVEPGWVRTPMTESLYDSIRKQALAERFPARSSSPKTSPRPSYFSPAPARDASRGRFFASMPDSICEVNHAFLR